MPKQTRFVVVADNHGDEADPTSVAALWDFIDDFKPDIRVHAGDCFDFRNLRRGATEDEKMQSLEDDWSAGLDFTSRLFKGGKRNYFLMGNHDDRLHQFARSASGLARDYAHDGIKRLHGHMARHKATVLPYDAALGVLQIGHLKVVHGYHAGANACRMHGNVYGNVLFGHVHTQESAPVSALEPAQASSIGCLCKRDMDYINAKTGKLKWACGWCYGTMNEDGTYTLAFTRKINDKFTYATEFRTV